MVRIQLERKIADAEGSVVDILNDKYKIDTLFEDTALCRIIDEKYCSNTGYISKFGLFRILELTIDGGVVKSLKGIEKIENLQKLNISHFDDGLKITHPSLTVLHISDSHITSISLSMPKLTTVTFDNCLFDKFYLEDIAMVKDLSLNHCHIKGNLDVSGLAGLVRVFADGNKIDSFTAKNLKHLQLVYLKNNPLKKLEVRNCPSLHWIETDLKKRQCKAILSGVTDKTEHDQYLTAMLNTL